MESKERRASRHGEDTVQKTDTHGLLMMLHGNEKQRFRKKSLVWRDIQVQGLGAAGGFCLTKQTVWISVLLFAQ